MCEKKSYWVSKNASSDRIGPGGGSNAEAALVMEDVEFEIGDKGGVYESFKIARI